MLAGAGLFIRAADARQQDTGPAGTPTRCYYGRGLKADHAAEPLRSLDVHYGIGQHRLFSCSIPTVDPMRAITVLPGIKDSARLDQVPEPPPSKALCWCAPSRWV